MQVIGSVLLGIVVTLLAVALAIVYIVILIAAIGGLGTMLERLFRKAQQREATSLALASRPASAAEPQKPSNIAHLP